MNKIRISVLLFMLIPLVCACGLIHPDDDLVLDGLPTYDVPYVDPHNGTFVNEHGQMTFNGDGKSVSLDIDDVLSQDTGLPAGQYDAEYYFFNPVMPGGYECGYNEAHELHFYIDGETYSINVGEVVDGKFMTGVDTTTADRITLFGDGFDTWYDFLLTK